MEQPRQEQKTPIEEINEIFGIANAINDVIYLIEYNRTEIYGSGMTPEDVEKAQKELEQLYYSIIRSEEKKLPDRAAEIIENAIKVFEEDLRFSERRLREEEASGEKNELKKILINYYQRSVELLTPIVENLKRIRELIFSLEEKQQPPTEEKEEVMPRIEQPPAEKKAPTKAESTPTEKKQPPAERKAPTLSNLALVVDSFVKLIIILNELADKAPTYSKDSLSYWNFLKDVYRKKGNEIKALIERIRQVYSDLVFDAKNAANFLIEVHKRLKEDLKKWSDWATQQSLAKADPLFIALVALPQLEIMLESIPDEAIRRAGILLQAAEETLSEYESAIQTIEPIEVGQKLQAEKLKAGKNLLERVKPLEDLPKFQRKNVSVSGLRLISSEEGRRVARKVFSDLSGRKISPKGKPAPRMIYLEVFHQMLEILHDFLWNLLPFGKEYKALEEITEEDFGPLKGVGMEWRNKAIELRKVLSEFLKYYRRRPRKSIYEDLKEIEGKLLESLEAFTDASNNLVAEYSKLKQQYAKLSKEEKEAFSNLPNFEALLNAKDGIPLLRDLIPKIRRWKRALETSQQLLRALLPQGDRERQQWLIEEKHTL
jgi:gas vesicle protein